MTRAAARDRSSIEVLAAATNKRQAAKIRDTKSTRSLYFTQEAPSDDAPNREYWVRGHPQGLYILGKTGGSIHLARLITPGRLSGMLQAATHVDVLEDREDLPPGILRMNTNGGGR